MRNFAHLRIFLVTSLVYQPRHSRDTNVFHSATFALQRGCFVPREWLAVKGLFCMVAHNCHSKTRNLTAKTKYLTAKPKTSRQKQNTSRQNQIHHSKKKYLTAKPKTSRQNQIPAKYITAKTKYLTAKPKTSRQKQNSSRQNQIHHRKSKRALVLLWVFAFAVVWLSKSCRFMIISISAYRFEVLNNV